MVVFSSDTPPPPEIFLFSPSCNYHYWLSTAAPKVTHSLIKNLLCSHSLFTKTVLPTQSYLEKGKLSSVSSRDMPTSPGAARTPWMFFPELPLLPHKVSGAQGVNLPVHIRIQLASPVKSKQGFVYVPSIAVDVECQICSLMSKTPQSGLPSSKEVRQN